MQNKPYKCPICKSESCGDDYHTRTEYATEVAAGDRMKVILLQLNDLIDIDNLQIYELKALVMALIDEHFHEEDHALTKNS
jgi:hypothetical protein